MKIKLLLFLCYLFTSHIICAQIIKPMPAKEEWHSYFYSRKANIQEKLYKLALDGKISAYKTDSLLSVYDVIDLKIRGQKEIIIPTPDDRGFDTVYNIPFNKDFKDIWFYKTISTSPFEETETNTLRAICFTFCPEVAGIITPPRAFCWFSVADLKLVLNKNEYEWIKLVYYYARHDNNILFRNLEYDGDVYWDLNLMSPSRDWLYADSLLYKKISHSLNSCSFNLENYLLDTTSGQQNSKVIYDHQRNRFISYKQFRLDYYIDYTIELTPSERLWGFDSVARISNVLSTINALDINTQNGLITRFNMEIVESNKSNKVIKFSIDADRIRKQNILPTHFWFFEDYFRWKK